MADFILLQVGSRGVGKSYATKAIIKNVNKPLYIYDINGEYKNFYKKPFVMFDVFLNQIRFVQNSFIVIEEASIFLGHNNTKRILIELLTRSRHTKNSFILNFHSFSKVPLYILDFTNYITVFKTNDIEDRVYKKFKDYKNLYEVSQIVNSHPLQYASMTICISPTIK